MAAVSSTSRDCYQCRSNPLGDASMKLKNPAFNAADRFKAAGRISRWIPLIGVAFAVLGLPPPPAWAQSNPIRIGVPTAMQLQVGRDTQDALKMAVEDLNAKGGVLGRQLEMVV